MAIHLTSYRADDQARITAWMQKLHSTNPSQESP
jgi:hypothetical protein